MITAIIFLIIAAASLATFVLLKQWAMQRHGIDLDNQSMSLGKVEAFTTQQKTLLLVFMVPAALVLVAAAAYILATVVVLALGATTPPA